MAAFTKFEGIEAWKKARELFKLIYKLIDENEFNEYYDKCNECSRLIAGLINYLKSSVIEGPKYI